VSARPTTAGVILDLLARANVNVAFGIPGVHNLGFWNALAPGRPTIMNVRHEQTCVYAADGLARATGSLAVAFTTTGPGAANTIGAFGEAAISGSPVLVISSEIPMKNRRDGFRGVLHEMVDQSSLFAPLAKKVEIDGKKITLSKSTTSAQEAIDSVNQFIALLSQAPHGCGYVGIPADILNQEFSGSVPETFSSTEEVITKQASSFSEFISQLKNELSGIKKIAIWAGGGATGDSEKMAQLSEHLAAPIFTSFAGRGVGIASAHYLAAPVHEPEIARALADAELLLVFGSQLDGMNTKNWTLPFPSRVYVVDADPEIATRNIEVSGSLKTSDLSGVVNELLQTPSRSSWLDAKSLAGAVRQRLQSEAKSKAGIQLVSAIESAWPTDGQIVCDMAVSGYWTGVYSDPRRVRRISYPVGWGTLGFALPASIGSAAINKSTLVVCGDGGIAFAIGDLATIKQEKLPITILLHDDGGYGMLRFDQQVMNHPERGVDLFSPDWQTLAEAYGFAFSETDLENLSGILAERAKSKEPGIVLIKDGIYPPRSTSPRWNES
jgi:thiamine pyrophosphate-dependent acetolactate synthase large subunit-like protein